MEKELASAALAVQSNKDNSVTDWSGGAELMIKEFETLVANSNLLTWTETLAILATYSGDQYQGLCEQLALRLEKEKFDTRSAVVCYICAGNFPKTVTIWTTQPSQGTQQLALQDLVEKMAVLQDAVKFNQADALFNSKI